MDGRLQARERVGSCLKVAQRDWARLERLYRRLCRERDQKLSAGV
jgi:hypothetical protein